MKTMKTITNLKITLDGFSSVLDIYPDSDLSVELERIRELSERTRVFTQCYTANETLVQVKLVRDHLKTYLDASKDVRALSGDWQRVGGDFLNAYQKVRKSEKKAIRKDDADCWSY